MKHLVNTIVCLVVCLSVNLANAGDFDEDTYIGGKPTTTLESLNKIKIDPKNKILAGDYSDVKSCIEIAKVKLDKKTPQYNVFGHPVTKNNDVIKLQPKGELFSDVSEIIGVDKNNVYVRNTSNAEGKEWGYVLVSNKSTKWIKDDLALGSVLYFVARYADNDTISIGSGNSKRNMNVRIAELVCGDVVSR